MKSGADVLFGIFIGGGLTGVGYYLFGVVSDFFAKRRVLVPDYFNPCGPECTMAKEKRQ